jgi:hypothetical protein
MSYANFRSHYINAGTNLPGFVNEHGAAIPANAVFCTGGDAYGFEYLNACTRCGGAGGSTGWPGFTCFDCGGHGRGRLESGRAYTPEQYAALQARRAKAEAKRAAKIEAKRAAERAASVALRAEFDAKHPGLYEAACNALRAKLVDNPMFHSYADMQVWGEHPYEFAGRSASFLHSMCDIVERIQRTGTCTDKQAAVLAGFVAREAEYAARKAAQEAAAASAPVLGTVGDKVTVRGTVRILRDTETRYGVSYFHVIETEQHQSVVYSGKFLAEQGEAVEFTGRIKEVTQYNGKPQYKVGLR